MACIEVMETEQNDESLSVKHAYCIIVTW